MLFKKDIRSGGRSVIKEKIRMYLTVIKRENRENYRKIKAYKDMYKDHRCWIIGNGPSLVSEDLDQIKGEFSFAANKIYYIFSKTLWRPSVYMCQDPRVIQSILNDKTPEKYFINESNIFISKVLKNSAERIFEDPAYYRLCKGKGLKDISFSNDFPVYVVEGLSVTYSMIQLAVYMGFKEIYLLGTEHDTLVALQYDHFYDKEESIISRSCEETDGTGKLNDTYSHQVQCTYNLWEQYKVLKKMAERKGVKIYNATIGGQLDIFERVDFKTLF